MAWWEPYIQEGEPKGLELAFYIALIVMGAVGLLGAAALVMLDT
jgi:hypothetical protein